MPSKLHIAVDFDSVLHKYERGFTGPEPEEEPVDGACAFIEALVENGYTPIIFSHRAHTPAGKRGIEEWLIEYGFPKMEVTDRKPAAIVYLDDRAYRFEGDFDAALGFIVNTQARTPWNRECDDD